MKFFLNEYDIRARIIPSCVSMIPLLLFYYFFLRSYLGEFIGFIDDYLKIVGDLSVAFILIFIFSQINRSLSKFFYEKKLFKDQLDFPTTKFLLNSNDKYTHEYKDSIKHKILKDFQINLLDANTKIENIELEKKKIVEAVGLIRDKVKDGRLLLQHNIEYGFYRNLIGGSTIALIFSIFNVIFFYFIVFQNLVFIFSIFLAFIYLMPIILNKKILINHGELYADILFKEYLSE